MIAYYCLGIFDIPVSIGGYVVHHSPTQVCLVFTASVDKSRILCSSIVCLDFSYHLIGIIRKEVGKPEHVEICSN